MMENEADREPEEERSKRKALSMEDLRRKYVLMVAEWQRQGASCPHRHGGDGWRRSSSARHQEHQAVVI
jgi:hypothetical protein